MRTVDVSLDSTVAAVLKKYFEVTKLSDPEKWTAQVFLSDMKRQNIDPKIAMATVCDSLALVRKAA